MIQGVSDSDIKAAAAKAAESQHGDWQNFVYHVGWGMTHTGAEYDDMGGASRFYPVFRYCPKASPSERPKVDGILHPTVKPVELMRWLVRLVTPADGLVLEPFAGSGTTLEACLLEHMQCTASELDPDYIKLIHARLSKPIQNELF